MLFNKRLLQTHLNNFEFPQEYDFERANKIISTWQKAIKDGNYDKTKETQVQSAFLNKFFNVVLGYAEMHDSPDAWNLHNEAKTDIDSTRADGALGFFTKDESQNITRAVIELKDAKTALDKKQSSRKDYDSPISQAFSYSSKFDRCDWIIVSNFKEIRLYHKDRGQGYYESFEILDLDNDKEFKRFYFLLCKENLIDKDRNSLLDKLVKDTSKNEEDISKEFYKDFKALRQELFIHICEHNPDIDKKCILEKTQKLLDRLIFIMFCEDSGNLLPMNTLKNYYETGKNLPMPNDDKIWQIIRGLFVSIDKGNDGIKPPINKYNGGLFAYDNILDNLHIKDDIWESVIQLANYDFESDLNVNILGHIFEQSLSDLEQIKAEIDGIEQDKTKSKRKKDGIFYTPEYITRYIVEQTIGKYLEENPDKLETIKILDPACGSGAFINQAHTFLKEQYKIRTEEKIANERSSKRGGEEFLALNLFKHTNIAETDRSILLNNLYGVDLNEESTEITKLALWLKTAKKDQPLQNLDNNIKCGNSLIDDPEIAGDKAFKWEEEFKDIMEQGGFDCIIGNPPYVFTRENMENKDKDYYYSNYTNTQFKLNTYILFVEKSLKLLKDNGILGFIIPNNWLTLEYNSDFRKYLLENPYKISITKTQKNVFEDASVDTVILLLQKKSNDIVDVMDLIQNQTSNLITSNIKTDYLSNHSYIINFEQKANKKVVDLCEKISQNSVELGHIFEVKNGVQAYTVGEATPTQTKEMKEKRVYHSFEKIDETWIKYLDGIDVKRYALGWSKQFIKYGKNLSRPRKKELFEGKRILVRQIPSNPPYSIFACHAEETLINDNNSMIIKIENENTYSSFYILSIINSKLTSFWFLKVFGKLQRGIFPQFKVKELQKFPIPEAKQEQKISLASKAEQMIELNKQLNELTQSALELLQAEYQPKKISQKLEKFYTLGQHPFLEELSKQGVKLDLSQKEELLQWYKQKSETLSALKTKIDQLDHSIDQEVYQLYNLTPEEIQIIEES